MIEKWKLPRAFETARTAFEQSIQPYIRITLEKHNVIALTDSKLFGEPYFPDNMPFPTNEKGEPLKLLAQLNFEQMPAYAHFPRSGLLQFFIDPYDDLYGMDFDDGTNQARFRVIYHEAFKETAIAPVLPIYNSERLKMPGSEALKMAFTLKEQPISLVDFRALATLGDVLEDYDSWDDYMEMYYTQPLHQIGGYSYFAQTDPREYEYSDRTVMLLQIDSQVDVELMWGDVGIANFFIAPVDLKNRDFSRVLYNWDCG